MTGGTVGHEERYFEPWNEDGPLFVIAGVLLLAGIQMMGIGLLGELQVRHFYTASHRAPYAVDRILRLRSEESLLQ